MNDVLMSRSDTATRVRALLFVGLSLSIGWGIRGNYGHQWGAALPGALSAMAAVIISGREDWMRRVAYFGVFGAMGWGVGAAMAYMVVIAYTHSGQSASVLYGFCCLCIIGFLWGAFGGIGTALPAFLTREKLTQFFVPLALLFFAWWLENLFEAHFIDTNPLYAKHSPMDWYDTDWTSALLALLIIPIRGAIRRKLDWGEKFILWMAFGWWAGFLLLKVVLHVEMAPHKSESWVGNLGMTIAALIYLHRCGLKGVVLSGLVTGVLGGLAFALGVLFKLIEVKSGLTTNWHSILEQSYGFMNGLAVATAMLLLYRTAPKVSDEPAVPRFYNGFVVAFLLLLLTYLNMWKQVTDWIDGAAVEEQLYFLTTRGWFDLFYALMAVTFIILIRAHLRRPLPFIPTNSLGKAQLLYLGLMWWMIIANFMKALVDFDKVRLVTEGTIFVNGLLCSLMVLLWATRSGEPEIATEPDYRPTIRRRVSRGAIALVLCPIICWGVVRAIYGDKFAGEAGYHLRFGKDAVPAKE